MSDKSKDRDLDDFINELKKSADKRFAPIDPESKQFEYEYILNNPDLFDRVSSLHTQIIDTQKQLKDLEENQQGIKEQISELTNIVAEAPSQIANDITQKVENFLTYYTNKVGDKITTHEQKLELERKKILEEYTRLREEAKRLYENPTNPIVMGVPGTGMEAMPYLAYLKQELSKETNATHNTLTEKLGSLESHLKDMKQEKQKETQAPVATPSLFQQMPNWLYILNLILLVGIFLFLVHHFVSNYSIKIEPSYSRKTKDEVYQEPETSSIPELLPIPEKEESYPPKKTHPERRNDVDAGSKGAEVALINYNDTNYLNSLLTIEQKRTLDSLR